MAWEVVIDEGNSDIAHATFWSRTSPKSRTQHAPGEAIKKSYSVPILSRCKTCPSRIGIEHFWSFWKRPLGSIQRGVSSLLVFDCKAWSALCLMYDDTDQLNASIAHVAKAIRLECNNLKRNSWVYDTRINLKDAQAMSNTTLLRILNWQRIWFVFISSCDRQHSHKSSDKPNDKPLGNPFCYETNALSNRWVTPMCVVNMTK